VLLVVASVVGVIGSGPVATVEILADTLLDYSADLAASFAGFAEDVQVAEVGSVKEFKALA
jgi:hypothetical protein